MYFQDLVFYLFHFNSFFSSVGVSAITIFDCFGRGLLSDSKGFENMKQKQNRGISRSWKYNYSILKIQLSAYDFRVFWSNFWKHRSRSGHCYPCSGIWTCNIQVYIYVLHFFTCPQLLVQLRDMPHNMGTEMQICQVIVWIFPQVDKTFEYI